MEGPWGTASGNREHAAERRAASNVVLGPDRTVVRGHDRAADRKPEAEALLAVRHEWLEHSLELTLRNAGTAIGHHELHDAIRHFSVQRQMALCRLCLAHRIARVQYEVEHDLL